MATLQDKIDKLNANARDRIGLVNTDAPDDPTLYGCTDSTAANFNSSARFDDGSCYWNAASFGVD